MLVELPGIGPWTADTYLLSALRRPDVWPVGDRALQVAAAEVKRLPEVPGPAELLALGRAVAPLPSRRRPHPLAPLPDHPEKDGAGPLRLVESGPPRSSYPLRFAERRIGLAVTWFSLDVDSADPPTLARWWAEVLGYEVVWEEDAYVAIAARQSGPFPGMIFNRIDAPKSGKNRLHST